jgi:hypothetical protein
MANVLIGCKLSNGFWMELVKPANRLLPNPVGQRYEIKGANSLRIRTENPINDGFAFTSVPEEFAKAWWELHKEDLMVKNGFVIMQPDLKAAQAEAKDNEGERTGLEAINPNGDPRSPKSVKTDTKAA